VGGEIVSGASPCVTLILGNAVSVGMVRALIDMRKLVVRGDDQLVPLLIEYSETKVGGGFTSVDGDAAFKSHSHVYGLIPLRTTKNCESGESVISLVGVRTIEFCPGPTVVVEESVAMRVDGAGLALLSLANNSTVNVPGSEGPSLIFCSWRVTDPSPKGLLPVEND